MKKTKPLRRPKMIEDELNRLRTLCDLFIPEETWQSINLVELIVEQGLDAAKRENGMDPDDVIVSLSRLLYSVIHRNDTLEDSRDNVETAIG